MEFLGPEHDGAHAGQVPRHLLVCTTPRTGGHAFSRAMAQQGLGLPMEYFNPDFMIPLQRRWLGVEARNTTAARENLVAYGQALESRRTRNHILAVKVFPSQFKLYAEAFPAPGRDLRYVWLSRKDKVAQTISLAVTLTTRRPFDTSHAVSFLPRIGTLDDQKMRQLLGWIEQQEAYWRSFFARAGQGVFARLTTEEFLARPQAAVRDLAIRLGLETRQVAGLQDAGPSAAPYQQDAALKAAIEQKFRPMLEAAAKPAD